MDIDTIVQTCIDDPAQAEALVDRLRRTLRPWAPTPDGRMFRANLAGSTVAYGQTTPEEMREADAALVRDHGCILLGETP